MTLRNATALPLLFILQSSNYGLIGRHIQGNMHEDTRPRRKRPREDLHKQYAILKGILEDLLARIGTDCGVSLYDSESRFRQRTVGFRELLYPLSDSEAPHGADRMDKNVICLALQIELCYQKHE